MLRFLMPMSLAVLCWPLGIQAADDQVLRSQAAESFHAAEQLRNQSGFQQSVLQERQKINAITPSSQRLNWDLMVHDQASSQQSQVSGKLTEYVRDMERKQARRREEGSLLVFVSLSLPDDLLQRYFAEAKQSGATLVFRGFKDNDYRAMQAEMARRGLHGPYQIDPVTTRRYGIQAVPAFLLILETETPCRNKACPLAAHIKAEGVASIPDFLQQALGQGAVTDKAVEQWQKRF